MSFSRMRILTGALLATIGTFAGNRNAVVPASQHIGIEPLVPKPTPRKKKKSNGTSNKRSWWSRYLAFRRAWAPAGGGAQECARRRAQIQKGMLGGCNEVQWSEKNQAEIDATRERLAHREAAEAYGREGAFDFGNGVTIGVDMASGSDVTAYAAVRRRDDGSMEVIDAGEFQPAGRDL